MKKTLAVYAFGFYSSECMNWSRTSSGWEDTGIVKRKKRFPKLMFILLVMLGIVLVWLLILEKNRVDPVNTALFKSTPAVVETPAPEPETPAPETPAAETPAAETPAPAPEAPAAETPAAEAPAPEPETPAPKPETPAPAAGTAVDTGVIRTVCPEGWLYIEQRDVFGQQDENGNYPVDPTKMCFCKGAATELDVFSKLSTYIYYQNTPYSQEVLDNTAMWYAETTPFTATINGVECQGFHAKDEDIFNAGQFYEYDFIFLPVDDGHHIQFMIMTAAPGNADVVSRDDADVQVIMSNFAVD